MADVTQTIAVNVEGQEKVDALNGSINRLGSSVTGLTGKTGTLGEATAKGNAEAAAGSFFGRIRQAASGWGTQVAQGMGAGFLQTVATHMGASPIAAAAAGDVALGMTGPILAGLGGLAAAASAAGAVMLLMKRSAAGVDTAAENTLQTYGRAQRLRTDMDTAESRGLTGIGLLGKGYMDMEDKLAKQLTNRRLEKSGVFARWGINAEAMQKEQQELGRKIDPLSFLEQFSAKREQLVAKLDQAKNDTARRKIERTLDQMADDTTRMFGKDFTRALEKYNPDDIRKFREGMERAVSVGPPSDPAAVRQRVQDSKDLLQAEAELKRVNEELDDRTYAKSIGARAAFVQQQARLREQTGPATADLMGAVYQGAWNIGAAAIKGFNEAGRSTGAIQGLTGAIEGLSAAAVKGAGSVGTFAGQFASKIGDVLRLLGVKPEGELPHWPTKGEPGGPPVTTEWGDDAIRKTQKYFDTIDSILKATKPDDPVVKQAEDDWKKTKEKLFGVEPTEAPPELRAPQPPKPGEPGYVPPATGIPGLPPELLPAPGAYTPSSPMPVTIVNPPPGMPTFSGPPQVPPAQTGIGGLPPEGIPAGPAALGTAADALNSAGSSMSSAASQITAAGPTLSQAGQAAGSAISSAAGSLSSAAASIPKTITVDTSNIPKSIPVTITGLPGGLGGGKTGTDAPTGGGD